MTLNAWTYDVVAGAADGGLIVISGDDARVDDVAGTWAALRVRAKHAVVATLPPYGVSAAAWADVLACGRPHHLVVARTGGRAPDVRRRGLVIMRAQPFHRGHLALCERALKDCDELVVVIAGAEQSHKARHPFSAGERLQMLLAAAGHLAARLWLMALPTPAVPALAMRDLLALAPPCHVVVTGNPIVASMAADAGLDVDEVDAFFCVDGAAVRATGLRAALARGRGPQDDDVGDDVGGDDVDDAWLDARVPTSVVHLLRQPWATRRLRAVGAEVD